MIDIEVKNLTKTFLQPDSKNKHQYKYLNVLTQSTWGCNTQAIWQQHQ